MLVADLVIYLFLIGLVMVGFTCLTMLIEHLNKGDF